MEAKRLLKYAREEVSGKLCFQYFCAIFESKISGHRIAVNVIFQVFFFVKLCALLDQRLHVAQTACHNLVF